MSTLKADTIQSTSGGAATLTKQHAAKQWLNATISSNTHTIQGSFNTSSLTDDGAGRTDSVLTNNMGSVRYSITSSCSLNGSYLFSHLGNNSLQTTAHYRINTANALAEHDTGDAQLDYDNLNNTIHGDLA